MKLSSFENTKKKSIVLLSAGLDSTVNLYQAIKETEVLACLTFNYGQKAVSKELLCAKKICDLNSIQHIVIDTPWLKDFGHHSSLTSELLQVPQGAEVQIDELTASQKSAQSVWVPNRNGIFLNIAAGLAESLKADFIIPGFNLEEAETFPDNSKAFTEKLNESFYYSTKNHVKAYCTTLDLNKTQIVKKALDLKVPLHLIWPCYQSLDQWCGQCESCLRFKRALDFNKIDFDQLKKMVD